MRIAIDIDEVLVDFLGAFLEHHNRNFGTNYRREDFHAFGMHFTMTEDLETIVSRLHAFNDTDEFKNILPMPDAIEAINRLAENHELVVVSSRPETIHDASREWVTQHFRGKFSSFHFSSHPHVARAAKQTKADLCELVKADYMIEDALDHALPCAQRGIKVLLFDTPWNQQAEMTLNMTRVHSWPEIVDVIEANKI